MSLHVEKYKLSHISQYLTPTRVSIRRNTFLFLVHVTSGLGSPSTFALNMASLPCCSLKAWKPSVNSGVFQSAGIPFLLCRILFASKWFELLLFLKLAPKCVRHLSSLLRALLNFSCNKTNWLAWQTSNIYFLYIIQTSQKVWLLLFFETRRNKILRKQKAQLLYNRVHSKWINFTNCNIYKGRVYFKTDFHYR